MKKFIFLIAFILSNLFGHSQTVGLTQHDVQSLDDGYVLFAPMGRTETFLIDKCGRKVKSWNSDYPPGLSVYLTPDGNLLRTGNTKNPLFDNGGQGGIIEIIDWDDNVIWTYNISDSLNCQHHDVKLMPNGNVLLIAWESKTAAEAIAQGRDPALVTDSVWSEQILEIEPTGPTSGNVVWEWHLWDHLVQDFDNSKPNFGSVADNPQLINLNYKASATEVDWVHFNSIDYNPALDQILISAHVMSEIWILDHSTSTMEAASHSGGNAGKGGDILYRWGNPAAYNMGTISDKEFFGQHNAQWIENGLTYADQIMVFNNGFQRPGQNYSTVDVIDPPINGFNYDGTLPYLPSNSTLIYNSGNPNNFYASNTSGAQILSNGNILLNDGPSGVFLEVDDQGNMVWEYVNPAAITGNIAQNNPPNANPVFRCNFYPSTFSGFATHTLTSGDIIENTNQLSASCNLNTSTAVHEVAINSKLAVFPNPFTNKINIRGPRESSLYRLINIMGQQIWSGTNIENEDFSHLLNGIYFLKIMSEGGQESAKIIKK